MKTIKDVINENDGESVFGPDRFPEMSREEKDAFIEGIEFARDWGEPVPEEQMKLYESLIQERRDIESVTKTGFALEYVENQTPEVCEAAVMQNGLALEYVKDQTPEVCEAAVMQDGLALRYVENQTPEICLAAVRNNRTVIRLIDLPPADAIQFAQKLTKDEKDFCINAFEFGTLPEKPFWKELYQTLTHEFQELPHLQETIAIHGYRCNKIDEWKADKDTFILGNCVDDSDFYYALVNDGETSFEYDHKPDRTKVEDDYIDYVAARELDRYEAEIGL